MTQACTCHSSDLQFSDYFSNNLYTWCTNCGNYGIHAAVKRALVAEGIAPCQTVLCFDIGCHGNGSDKIGGYRVHGLHGRVTSLAAGVSVANTRLKVLAFAGDGGTLGEGINHLIKCVRANFDVTFILHNNLNYGLTQGQASSTTKPGMKMTASPDGITSEPIHPARFMFSLNPTFVARSFSGNVPHMTKTIQAGLAHRGFSFIEILQSCPTYNKTTPHEWYQERVFDVDTMPHYDKSDMTQAQQISADLDEKIAIGVLYQQPNSQPFLARQANRQGVTTELVDEVVPGDARSLFDRFR